MATQRRTGQKPAPPQSAGSAVRLLVTEVMNIQRRLADEKHPDARTLWRALERFSANPQTRIAARSQRP